MKSIVALSLICLSGCFYLGAERYADVVQRPPSQWSSRDCLTVIVAATVENLSDKAVNIQVVATPYYPSVMDAISQLQRTQYHWSENEASAHQDELLRGASGLYIDRQKSRLVNSRGNYLKDPSDVDSLLILVSLRNKSYPCNIPTVTMKISPSSYGEVPLMSAADWPCYIPDITDLESRIVLTNDTGDTLHPRYVWGRRNNQLREEETLFVMFPLRCGTHHLLLDSKNVFLSVLGFDSKLNFALDLTKMR